MELLLAGQGSSPNGVEVERSVTVCPGHLGGYRDDAPHITTRGVAIAPNGKHC
jgi:hypothetical protein